MLAKYVINKCSMTRIQEDSCIFYKKDDEEKLDIVVDVHIDNVFMLQKLETLEKLNELIKLKFSI